MNKYYVFKEKFQGQIIDQFKKAHPSTPDCERSARKNSPQAESGRRGQIAAFSFLGSSKQYVALAGINIECFGRLIDCDWLFGD